MGTMRIVVVIATLAAVSVATAAQQTQTQGQPNQTQTNQAQGQTNQNQNQPQNQQTQPKKKGFWDKVKDATQQGQNTAQQGQNTVQQVTQPGQSGTQQVQNGAQGVQQGMQGVQGGQGGFPSNQGNGAFSGGGGGAGACGQSCFDAGPFQANVSQMMLSQEGGWHVIRMNFQFHNSSNQPLIIAYHDGSMVMVDNNGNAYIPAGGNPGQLQGMGIDRGSQTDAQFVLAPGQTGNAMFAVARGRPNTSPIGTSYSYNLTIDELQAQNGAMAIPVRTYNLNFPSLAPGSSSASFASGSAPASGVVGGGGTAGYAGTAVPQSNAQGGYVQQGAAPTPQQRMVNAKPAQGTPASVVNNAAIRTPVSTNTTAAKPTAAAATTKTATPVKKTTSTPTTTTATPQKQ